MEDQQVFFEGKSYLVRYSVHGYPTVFLQSAGGGLTQVFYQLAQAVAAAAAALPAAPHADT